MATRSRNPTAAPDPAASALRQERRRLAQLLHNTICQELTGICFLAGAAAHKHASSDPAVGRKFEEIADLVQRAGAGLAEIVYELGRQSEE